MRNILAKLISEYGQESVRNLRVVGETGDENGRLPKSQKIHAKMLKQGDYTSKYKTQDHSEDP